MAALNLFLLGGFELCSSAGAPVTVAAKKAKALLAYLAVSAGRAHPRDKLAALLWEERDEAQARHNLRQALASLRRSLPEVDRVLLADSETLALQLEGIEVDVRAFEGLTRAGTPESLGQAIELYRGELLDGLDARSSAFEEWLMEQRSVLRERALAAMSTLLGHHLESGGEERALRLALRLVALDPLRESVHRTLMRLHAKAGRYGAALKQYRLCRSILQRELGVAPEAETEALYRTLYAERREPVRLAPPEVPRVETAAALSVPSLPRVAPVATAPPVGREAELKQLQGALAKTLAGERQLVFLTGEPGIGKTALADAFIAQLARQTELWVTHGQCIDHHGAGEAYLPVLEALGRLARGAGGEQLVQLLRRQAPTWLSQMPALIDEAELEVLSRRAYGTAPERMARELVEALEALTAERPLVLWLEDLHWSDFSTVNALAMLARRREPARLLVVGTYRPAEVMASGHPLRAWCGS